MDKYSFRSTFEEYAEIEANGFGTAVYYFCESDQFKTLFKDKKFTVEFKGDFDRAEITITNDRNIIQEVIFVRKINT